jgi:hypothetical protein
MLFAEIRTKCSSSLRAKIISKSFSGAPQKENAARVSGVHVT